ncbi:hypothetical protein DPEC_G00027990 [Dallia pectoralis]|uniref:Uncharacterized protein n=1 Tax=Dallia pectoralis TaxID=75939 RepID=A0ACC2HI12_DALPE|nr:hypothetical protein DPEC_G00027990 [Dallia pectoralis]
MERAKERLTGGNVKAVPRYLPRAWHPCGEKKTGAKRGDEWIPQCGSLEMEHLSYVSPNHRLPLTNAEWKSGNNHTKATRCYRPDENTRRAVHTRNHWLNRVGAHYCHDVTGSSRLLHVRHPGDETGNWENLRAARDASRFCQRAVCACVHSEEVFLRVRVKLTVP